MIANENSTNPAVVTMAQYGVLMMVVVLWLVVLDCFC